MIHKSSFIVFLLAGWPMFSGCTSFNLGNDAGLYEKVKAASVEILVDGHLEGSGWFADPAGYVVTAAHAVNRTNIHIEVVFGTKGRMPAELVARDKGSDIALLLVKGEKGARYPYLMVAKCIPRAGEPIYLYGSALYCHGIMLGGIVAREGTTFTYYGDRQMLVRCYHVTAPSPPGTSGGPWVDRRGNVVGNQSGFITHHNAGAGIALVSPPDSIGRLVTSRQSILTAVLGCGLEELWTQSPGFIKRFPQGTEGVITIPIDKDGPVDAAGLTKESLIVSVEGKSIRYKDDFYAVISSRKPGDVINVKVLDPDKTTAREVKIKLVDQVPAAKKADSP